MNYEWLVGGGHLLSTNGWEEGGGTGGDTPASRATLEASQETVGVGVGVGVGAQGKGLTNPALTRSSLVNAVRSRVPLTPSS
jgi:hypothetical protein